MENQPSIEKKSNNKVFIIIGAVIFICVCVVVIVIGALAIMGPAIQNVNEQISEGLSYSGRADELLRGDVLNAIAGYESGQNNCSDISLSSGQILSGPDQSSDGSWTETWQINACGASHLYTVSFTPSPQGGTDFAVTPMEQ